MRPGPTKDQLLQQSFTKEMRERVYNHAPAAGSMRWLLNELGYISRTATSLEHIHQKLQEVKESLPAWVHVDTQVPEDLVLHEPVSFKCIEGELTVTIIAENVPCS